MALFSALLRGSPNTLRRESDPIPQAGPQPVTVTGGPRDPAAAALRRL